MIKTLAKCIGKYKKESIITPIFTAVEVFLEILIPFITASIIDKGIQAGDMRKVGIYGGIMLIIAFLSLFCGIQAGKYGAAASTGFACNLREKMYENIQTFSFSNIDKFSTAGLVTRMTTDVTNVQNEECIAAAKLANADGFIKRLPDGYNTVLTGGGANLSQGQRQLLAIARAAVADPPVLILDEATSSIDTRTEKLVQRGMDALMTGRTSFVIAHRLSTVRNADCIMVMEQGRIIERGTHDQLMEEKGRYYQLYTGKSISA